MIRIFDIIFSMIALLLLMPVFVPVTFLLLFTGERQVFYFQERVGKNGKKINLIKFATMLKNSPNIGTANITILDDPRVLPFGKFLRKSKINELPQLYNILIGDMSIVGPRPLTKDNFDLYSDAIKTGILSVRPGLTGVGSILFRDEEAILGQETDPVKFYANYIAPYKGELELWYLKNKSVGLYFKIIFVTAFVVFKVKYRSIHFIFRNLPLPPKELGISSKQ